MIIASYVRAISQVPEVNRFIMNKQFYNRKELTVSMTILMDTPDGSLQENVIKVKYDPSDTIYDVAARLVQKIEANRKPETPGFSVKLASFALKIPGLATLLAGTVKLLDRYGLCPGLLIDELPFHTGMFITNNASIGLHSVFEHHPVMGPEALAVYLHENRIAYPVAVDAYRDGDPVREPVSLKKPNRREGEQGQDERDDQDRDDLSRHPDPDRDHEQQRRDQQELGGPEGGLRYGH